jgi:hypothetical protein
MTGELAVMQNAFQERVKNHMKDVIGTLIPDEQFAKMVNDEIKAFFETPVQFTWESGSGYRSDQTLKTNITPFRQMVWSKVKPIVESELQKWFDGEQEKQFREFVAEMIGSEAVKEGTALSTQKLMMVMAGQMFYQCATQANMQMRSDLIGIFAKHQFPYQLMQDLGAMQVPSVYSPQTSPGAEPQVGTVPVNASHQY